MKHIFYITLLISSSCFYKCFASRPLLRRNSAMQLPPIPENLKSKMEKEDIVLYDKAIFLVVFGPTSNVHAKLYDPRKIAAPIAIAPQMNVENVKIALAQKFADACKMSTNDKTFIVYPDGEVKIFVEETQIKASPRASPKVLPNNVPKISSHRRATFPLAK